MKKSSVGKVESWLLIVDPLFEDLLLVLLFLYLVPLPIVFQSNSAQLWFFVLLWGTLLFSLIVVFWNSCVYSIFIYFIIQEIMSLLLLGFFSLFWQCFFLMFKAGLSPFFFWALSMGSFLEGTVFFWFLSMQKLYPLWVLLELSPGYMLFFLLCLLLIYLILWGQTSTSDLLILSSSETLGWGLLINFSGSLVFLIFYLLSVFLISQSLQSVEVVLYFMSLPVGLAFLVKFIGLWFFTSSLFLVFIAGLIFSTMLATSLVFLKSLSSALLVFLTSGSGWLLFLFPLVLLLPEYCI